MTVRQFNQRMSESGFASFSHPLRYPTFHRVVAGVDHFVCRDNVRGGSYRLFLGCDCLPAMHPRDVRGPSSLEAESPWFSYVAEGEKATALQQCWEFLSTIGFRWLDAPQSLTADEWRERHNILIQGVAFTRRQGYLP